MKQFFVNFLRAAVIGAALVPLVLPAAAPAATAQLQQTITRTYQTTFVKDYGPSVPFTGGTLRLTLTKDGYVNGYYTPPGTVAFVDVIGGRNGASVWFDIGNGHRTTHVTGTLQGGRIVGYASDQTGAQYRFTAVPSVQPG